MDRLFCSTVDFRPLESLSTLAFVSTLTSAFPLLPQSIRILDISGNCMIRWPLQDLAASPLPNHKSLTAGNSYIAKVNVLAILEPSLEKRSLRSLSLHRCPRVEFNSLKWLMKHSENLERLAIGGNDTVTDGMLKEVAMFRNLRYLDLSRCGISGIGLMNVVYGSPGALREVNVSECINIGLDAVQLAAKSGVKILNG